MQNNREDKQKLKYQLIYLSVEEKLNMILSNKVTPQHIRMSSAHQTYSNDCNTHQYHNQLPLRAKPKKTVCFGLFASDKNESQDLKQSTKTDLLKRKTQKKITNVAALKSYKSLNESYVNLSPTEKPVKSTKSLKCFNSQIAECKRNVEQYLKKINFFKDSQFSQKQLMIWIQPYFNKQKALLKRLFFRQKKHRNHHHHIEWQLQTNQDVIVSKLQIKIKDNYNATYRYIKASQIGKFNNFIEQLYIQKNRIKMKQMEDSITSKMGKICHQVRNFQNNQYVLALRKKPTQISHFVQDLHQFQDQFGTLKRVSAINRTRFKMVNDADIYIDKQAFQMNEEVQQMRKMDDNMMLATQILHFTVK